MESPNGPRLSTNRLSRKSCVRFSMLALPPSKAAHDTGLTQEPTEANEANQGQESSRVQQNLEEHSLSVLCGILSSRVLAACPERSLEIRAKVVPV